MPITDEQLETKISDYIQDKGLTTVQNSSEDVGIQVMILQGIYLCLQQLKAIATNTAP